MGDLFSITLVSGIILLCLYLPYKLLLARKGNIGSTVLLS